MGEKKARWLLNRFEGLLLYTKRIPFICPYYSFSRTNSLLARRGLPAPKELDNSLLVVSVPPRRKPLAPLFARLRGRPLALLNRPPLLLYTAARRVPFCRHRFLSLSALLGDFSLLYIYLGRGKFKLTYLRQIFLFNFLQR